MGSMGPISAQIDKLRQTNPALRHGDAVLTYEDLNRRADHLATRLAFEGVHPGHPVAIFMDRSFEWVIAALATLRIGAPYVPVDPSWPDDRVSFVIQDSGATHVAVNAWTKDRASSVSAKVIEVECSPEPIGENTFTHRFNQAAPEDLAYIIYTSGSSGYPKGVELTHANLDHLIAWHIRAFGLTSSDKTTHLAGLSFDAAVWEIWPTLAAGACLHLADETTRTSPELLQRWLVAEEISISFVPTALAMQLIDRDWPRQSKLRFLLTGGDALRRRPKAGLPFKVINNYGPTECTVVATSGEVKAEPQTVPGIGRAMDGAVIYLLDANAQPVPEGAVGEIYIGGSGVGKGYRNLPELTSRNFVKDPFAQGVRARMYRSGDFGLMRPDGDIEFHGRTDSQEKIRGQRLELDEISNVLYRHEQVEFATVVSAPNGCEKRLVAYVMPVKGSNLTSTELQEFLAQSLPDFMVPSTFVRLTKLPLSHNGKIERSALEPPSIENVLPFAATQAPESAVAEAILGIVRELLGTQAIGIEDDFFLAGGHSLLGTQLILRIRQRFQVDVSLRDLFEARTIQRLSEVVEELLIADVDAMTDEEAQRQVEALL